MKQEDVAQHGDGDERDSGKIATLLALGLQYDMSKRTAIYGSYGSVDNGAAQNIGVRSNGVSVAASGLGKDPSAFGVGLVHSF